VAQAGPKLDVTCPANAADRSQRIQVTLAESVVDCPAKADDLLMATSARIICQRTRTGSKPQDLSSCRAG
jgi:hypothetical protein